MYFHWFCVHFSCSVRFHASKMIKCCFLCYIFVKNSVGRVGALLNYKLSKIGQEGGLSTLIWIMSLNILFFFDVTHVTPYIWTSGQIQLGKGTLGEKVVNVRNFGPSVLLKALKNLIQEEKYYHFCTVSFLWR